jgi:hypothetical protein
VNQKSVRRLLTIGALLVVACKDPTVGPPPRKLNDAQTRRVATFLLDGKPSPSQPANVMLGGGQIRFLGTDVRPDSVSRGERVRIAHYFELLKPVDKSWKLFVHIENEGSPGILVNADHVPVEGLLPTDRWQQGKVIEDSYSVSVPAHAGDQLVGYVGFYRFDDRMPVDSRAAHDGSNRLRAFRLKVSGEGPVLPTYLAAKLKAPIEIDGELDDKGWEGVASTGRFVRTGDGGAARYRTEAKLAWDDEALYVGFEVEDEDVWAKLEEDDDPIYGEEVVEVFLDADADGRTYNELQLSPRGVRFDAYFPARRQGMDLGWSSGMQTAVKVNGTLNDPTDRDQGWTAEMRIPVAHLASVPRWPPQAGDKWRFNLYRLEWHTDRKVNEGSSFSPPLVGDFHNLSRFGWLEFAP